MDGSLTGCEYLPTFGKLYDLPHREPQARICEGIGFHRPDGRRRSLVGPYSGRNGPPLEITSPDNRRIPKRRGRLTSPFFSSHFFVAGSNTGAEREVSQGRASLTRSSERSAEQRYRSQPGGCIERSRSPEAARNHQPIAALPGNAENVWSALSGLYRKRAENRPIGISASQSISHSRNLRATPDQTHHSTMGEISTLSRGIEGCRGMVSGTSQGERSKRR